MLRYVTCFVMAGAFASGVWSTTALAQSSAADSLLVQHTFTGVKGDGSQPLANLVQGADGSYYGTTSAGGASGDGIVFKFADNGVFTVVHAFSGGNGLSQDGATPFAPVTIGPDGTLYGTTHDGGSSGDGTVYKISPNGAEIVLHSFTGGNDGLYPIAAVIIGKDGKLYGTTGGYRDSGYGTIFSLNTDGSGYLVQYRFNGTSGGRLPYGTLTPAPGAGVVLYGTTYGGSTSSAGGTRGDGTVYAVTPGATDGDATVRYLHQFGDGSVVNDGVSPEYGPLLIDAAGNVYGETTEGGSVGYGTVFEIAATSDKVTILHNFGSGTDGEMPDGGLTLASDGNFYGATFAGGTHGGDNPDGLTTGDGTLFRISSKGTKYAVIHNFDSTSNNDGASPYNRPIQDNATGELFGTTFSGGAEGDGAIYQLLAGLPQPNQLRAVSATPSSLVGGASSAMNRVYVSGEATESVVVALTSSNTAVAIVPSSATIDPGFSSHVFTIATRKVTTKQTVTITATLGGVTQTATLTVTP